MGTVLPAWAWRQGWTFKAGSYTSNIAGISLAKLINKFIWGPYYLINMFHMYADTTNKW